MTDTIRQFCASQSGSVTSDWIVIMLGMIVLAIAAFTIFPALPAAL